MRYVLVVVALLLAACGGTPTAPRPLPPPDPPPVRTVEFRVLVHGLQQEPLVNLPITLRVPSGLLPTTTDATGHASWRVVPGEPFTVLIQLRAEMIELFPNRIIASDAASFISVPLCNPTVPICR